ncbi:hypothetical protein [Streptomyces sp. NPDC055105]|uniref:hypothetical protein n=1 Tax=Streptomyces sp. NPDC055105 TaxID=3365719 RepID=UPI0037D76165
MRRPAQHDTAWSHPYTGLAGLAVFYNDGGEAGDPPAAPPATASEPPKPSPPAQRTFTQTEVEALAAKEKAQGRRSAAKEFADKHGFGSIEDAEQFIAAARKAQDDALTEQQRKDREIAEREQAVEKERAELAAERAATRREKALARLGATDTDLDDAAVLLERALRDAPDADDATVAEAAAALKERRPALFGAAAPATPPVGTLPPAPGGSPAGGPSRTAGSKDNVQARMNALAEKMGYRTKSDAA